MENFKPQHAHPDDTVARRAIPNEIIIGKSPAIQLLKQQIQQAAISHSTILIEGESGTGKELVARSLHRQSHRSGGPFIVINCATLQDQLLESELFGYRRGAFTGAVQNKPGLFEVANQGTLFMDEIGEIPLSHQSKLLRALETMEFMPLGGTHSVKVDVRVVAATNRSLRKAVEREDFREDLYYRISVLTLEVPPLRERQEDIPELAEYFLQAHAPNRKVWITEDAIKHLMNYRWPGNVRELFNLLERSLIFLSGDKLSAESLYIKTRTDMRLIDVTEISTLDEVIKNHIIQVLVAKGNNKTKAAQALGIHRRQLYRLLDTNNINTR
jgi:transcriptional regulator with PAS, ATPase and Fis domain